MVINLPYVDSIWYVTVKSAPDVEDVTWNGNKWNPEAFVYVLTSLIYPDGRLKVRSSAIISDLPQDEVNAGTDAHNPKPVTIDDKIFTIFLLIILIPHSFYYIFLFILIY